MRKITLCKIFNKAGTEYIVFNNYIETSMYITWNSVPLIWPNLT